MEKKYFGTDGIRGTVGTPPITPDFVLKLGWAVGRVFAGNGQPDVLIGKDTRISGYMFESALEAGLSAAGVNTKLLGPMPTPGIAYLTRAFRAQTGIVISASHNSYQDNGIKFFSSGGLKLPDNVELEIEHQLEQSMTTVDSSRLGKASRLPDAAGRYIEFCKSTIPAHVDLNRFKIVVDCANGSTYHIAPHVFRELGANVISIGVDPNGLNINHKCGATYPATVQKAVLEHQADIGISFDGDGDRIIMVDHLGEIVDGDEIIYIIAKSRLASNKAIGPIIGTQMSNFGLEQALQRIGLELKRAAVGDRYVMEMLLEHNAILGGENSGHIICKDRTTTGDGIITALQVMAEIWKTARDLNELKRGIKKYPQKLVNVKINGKTDFLEIKSIKTAVTEAETQLNGNGRILLRPSGTEPLIRVMVEGPDSAVVDNLADHLAAVISSSLA